MTSEPRLLEFPSGIPYLSGPYGITVYKKDSQMFTLLNRDWDLWFMEEGRTEWELQDGRPITLQTDHFLLCPPYYPLLHKSRTPHVKLWFCHFDFQKIPANLFLSFREDCLERDAKTFIPMTFSKRAAPRVWKAHRDLLSLGLELSTGQQRRDSSDRLVFGKSGVPWRLSQGLLSLVSEIARFGLESKHALKTGTVVNFALSARPYLKKLFQILDNRPDYNLKTKDLANQVGLSVRQTERVFAATTGQSLKKYITSERLRRARLLLKESYKGAFLPLKKIGQMCGYRSAQHFNNDFKKNVGVTPRHYRNRYS